MTKVKTPIAFAIFKAPIDPGEKRDWDNQMLRIQVAMWLDDKCICLHCKHKYESVDDFIKRNPCEGHTKHLSFVCTKCYLDYKAALKEEAK